jgi:shikimate dehydrogenase
MIRLALVGKNISHSKSEKVYQELLGQKIDYKLLDYESEAEIKELTSLLSELDGISITSPYKKHFIQQVEVLHEHQSLGAINCIRNHNGKMQGINTDYLAVKDIIKNLKNKYGELEAVVFGSGVMSLVTKKCLDLVDIKHRTLARKAVGDFSNRVIKKEEMFDPAKQLLIINCCSREFVFKGTLPKESIFLDHNYCFSEHETLISKKVQAYIDGDELLKRQAIYALSFWNLSK